MMLAGSPPSQALSTDREQAIELQADRGWLDEQTRSSRYEGHVVLTQGSLRLEGDRMELYYTEDDQLRLVIMEGQPVRGRQQPVPGAADHEAEALRLEYHAAEGRILLIGKAVIRRPQATVQADRIEYDTIKNAVVAQGDGSTGEGQEGTEDGRVKLTIQPDAIER